MCWVGKQRKGRVGAMVGAARGGDRGRIREDREVARDGQEGRGGGSGWVVVVRAEGGEERTGR